MSEVKAPLFIKIIGWLTLIDSILILFGLSFVLSAVSGGHALPKIHYLRVALMFSSGTIGLVMGYGLLNMERWAGYGIAFIYICELFLNQIMKVELGGFAQMVLFVIQAFRLAVVVGILIYHNQMKPASPAVYGGIGAFILIALFGPAAAAVTLGGSTAVRAITEPQKIVTVETVDSSGHRTIEQHFADEQPTAEEQPKAAEPTSAPKKLTEVESEELKKHYLRGTELEKAGSYSEAIAEFAAVLAIDGNKPGALYHRAMCSYQIGTAAHVKKYLEIALSDFKRAREIFAERGKNDDAQKCEQAAATTQRQLDNF